MPKIDGIQYPDAGAPLLKNRQLGDMFRAYVKSRMAEENTMFIDAVVKKRDPKKQYATFFDVNGKHCINVDSKYYSQAKALAAKKDWKSKDWKGIYDGCEGIVNRMLSQNFEFAFYKSPAFKAFHARALRKKIKIPAQLKEELGMEDDAMLIDTVALFMSDREAGAKAAVVLSKRKKTHRSPREVLTSISKFFKMAS
ncbi:MAG: hypothetical protein AAF501_07590 [Pseudomonadota bacterium]